MHRVCRSDSIRIAIRSSRLAVRCRRAKPCWKQKVAANLRPEPKVRAGRRWGWGPSAKVRN